MNAEELNYTVEMIERGYTRFHLYSFLTNKTITRQTDRVEDVVDWTELGWKVIGYERTRERAMTSPIN